MAEVTITPVRTLQAGLDPAGARQVVDNADAYIFANDSRVVLHVRNNGAGSTDATILTPGGVSGLAIADQVVTIPIGEDRFIGPFSTIPFNNPQNQARVSFSTDDTVDLVALRLP